MAKKILITGAEGMLGKALLRKLSDKYNVIPTAKQISLSNKYENIKILDITERKDVEATIHEFNPNIIINCAAYTDVDQCEINHYEAHLVNVVGLRNLIHASKNDTYFVQISSDHVFDGEDGPYSEEDHTYPVNYYGKTKLEAENIIRGSRIRYLIIRPNVLYNENLCSKGNFFAWVYKSLANDKQISVVDDQISNPTYIAHLTQVIFQCIILNTEGIYHYGSDDYISRYKFATSIANIFELDNSLIMQIDTEELSQNIPSYIAKRPKHSGLKTFKIEEQIGISTYSIDYSLTMLKNSLVRA